MQKEQESVTRSFRLKKMLLKELEKLATDDGRSTNNYVAHLLNQHVKSKKPNKT